MFGDLWDLIFSYFLIGIAAVLVLRYKPGPPPLPMVRTAYA
jgi:hypothetical protein